jgi:two-component system cell cycle sensor histidine kinase/response regulator CckA
VDDEEAVLLTLRLVLESVGFRVATARSAAEALKTLQSGRFHAAVLDYWLPTVNGVELAKQLKKANPSMPIVFLSAYRELPGEALGLAEAWFKKGEGTPEELLTKLSEIVNRGASAT